MVKIRVLNTEIVTNEKKRTIAYILNVAIVDDGWPIYDGLQFVGTSKCSPKDNWDPVIGRRIAESKAKFKAFRFVKNMLTRDAAIAERNYKDLQKNLDNFEYYTDREQTHIKALIEETNE